MIRRNRRCQREIERNLLRVRQLQLIQQKRQNLWFLSAIVTLIGLGWIRQPPKNALGQLATSNKLPLQILNCFSRLKVESLLYDFGKGANFVWFANSTRLHFPNYKVFFRWADHSSTRQYVEFDERGIHSKWSSAGPRKNFSITLENYVTSGYIITFKRSWFGFHHNSLFPAHQSQTKDFRQTFRQIYLWPHQLQNEWHSFCNWWGQR